MTKFPPPFPYFGGKSSIADRVWQRFGVVKNYVEPFFGSGAVMFANPADDLPIETVNDADGFVANFWRATQAAPDEVAHWADGPINENDLHARHYWLVERKGELQALLEGSPDYYDAKIAGWWVWGINCWIGGGWCAGVGPWHVVDGKLVNGGENGINRKRPHLGPGMGVHRQRPHLGNAGMGVHRQMEYDMTEYFHAIAARLRRVRVCCGDWSRVCGPSPTFKIGLTAVFLDPPYSVEAGRDNNLYTVENLTVAHDVQEWCIENGDNPLLRIALCGYEGEHNMPKTWECIPWKANGGYSHQAKNRAGDNRHRERIWFSPHCLRLVEVVQHGFLSEVD